MLANLTSVEVRQLAKDIRKLLEPDGASSTKTTSEIEVRRLLFNKYSDIQIDGIADIISILQTNYGEKTIARLKSKIKKCVVWDASVTNMPTKELLKFFYTNTNYVNLITSLTLQELSKLAHKGHECATVLVNNILADINSKYCMTVTLARKNQYVDTQLIDYCECNDYALFTNDLCFALRAKSHKIKVFTPYGTTSKYEYFPDDSGKDIILDVSILNRSLYDVIQEANAINGRKFLITSDFVDELEKKKSHTSVDKFVHFLLADTDETYSSYIPSSETCSFVDNTQGCCEKLDIQELAKKYNAVIFTANDNQAFNLKSSFNTAFKYLPSQNAKSMIKNYAKDCPISTSVSTEKSDVDVTYESDKSSDVSHIITNSDSSKNSNVSHTRTNSVSCNSSDVSHTRI